MREPPFPAPPSMHRPLSGPVLIAAMAAGLTLALVLIAFRRIAQLVWANRPEDCAAFSGLIEEGTTAPYNLGVLALNYFEHGFVSRGLGGSVFAVLDRLPPQACSSGLLWFQALSALFVIAPLLVLLIGVARVRWRAGVWLALILIVSPQLFWAWGGDPGRVDMLRSGFVAWAVVAALHERTRLAFASIIVGSLVHESAAIYGLPLLLALLIARRHDGAAWRAYWRPALVVLMTLGTLHFVQAAITSAVAADIVASVLRGGPQSNLRDVAAYMAPGGWRTLVASLCQSYGRAATPLYLAVAFATIALYALILPVAGRDMRRYALAAVVPMVLISLVAVDYGRWLMLGVLNGWLFAAVRIIGGATPPPAPRRLAAALAALAVLVLMRPTTVYAPSRATERVAALIWGEEGTRMKDLDRCDPGWRTRLGS